MCFPLSKDAAFSSSVLVAKFTVIESGDNQPHWFPGELLTLGNETAENVAV